ncbi:hypothetical protein [Guptibacillus hwajinpoensis]|uniref:hypothetical protein n=1 Tax=Guptibacillus hwajinpoensis TaxID=208199 RepID=UPI00384F7773
MDRSGRYLIQDRSIKILIWLISMSSILLIAWWRIAYATELPRSWDQVDFSLALSRFDLFAMQPHFPGYPYFILGGMLLNKWIGNPALALTFWNGLLMLFSVYPAYAVSRSFLSKTLSMASVALIQSMVFVNVLTIQPMSEAAAVAILWWYLWSLQKAFHREHSFLSIVVASFLFSLLLGVRLSYLPFGVGLLLLLIQRKKQHKSIKSYSSFLLTQIGIAAIFQLIWVGGLAASEGGVAAFLQLAFGFSEGHFEEWGGTAVSASAPLLERISHLILNNIVWTGLSGHALTILLLYLILFMFMIFQGVKSSGRTLREISWFGWAFVAMAFSYFLWALLAQNIDKPRHILPLPGIIVLGFLWIGLRRQGNISTKIMLGLAVMISIQSIVSYSTMKEANDPAAVYQLMNYVEQINEPVIVYTWEETRVMSYNKVSFEHEQIYTYSTFLSDLQYYHKHRVFLTGQVLDGFKKQKISMDSQIKKVKEFHSSTLYDPVYHDIVLYEFLR